MTDGAPVNFKVFMTKLFGTHNIDTSRIGTTTRIITQLSPSYSYPSIDFNFILSIGTVPIWLLKGFAWLNETAWDLLPLPGTPLIVPTSVALIGETVTSKL